MLYLSLSNDLVIFMYLYMFVYNITILGIFWIFFSVITSNLKTIYAFSTFSFESSYLFFLTVFLFSLAGVPPFIGFFSKLFILNILLNKSFLLLYFMFFIILILGLYFYIQNIRFLHSSNFGENPKIYLLGYERIQFVSFYFLINVAFIIVNGVSSLDDLALIFVWLFY